MPKLEITEMLPPNKPKQNLSPLKVPVRLETESQTLKTRN